MDVATLQSIVENALTASPFSLSGATLSSGNISSLFNGQFGADALTFTNAPQLNKTADSIQATGTLASAYLGAADLDITATFTVVDATAEVSAVVSGFPANWTLSAAYPALKGSWFDAFSFTAPAFTLTSSNSPTLPAGFPSQCGMGAYGPDLAAQLVSGLSFAATLALNATVEGLEWLLGGLQWSVSGPIELAQDLPSIWLSSAAGTPISLGKLSAGFRLGLVAAILQPADPTASPTAVATCLQAEADVQATVAGSLVTIPVATRSFSPTLGLLVVESNLTQLADLVVDDIANLIAGASTAGQIPDAFPALDDISLQSIEVVLIPATQTLVQASATVTFKPGKDSWSAFGGDIVFQGLAVTFSYLFSSGEVTASVECAATISGGTLTAGIVLPEMSFCCELEEDSSLDIGSIVGKIAGGSVSMPSVSCTQLKFFGTVPNLYRFQADVSESWSIGNVVIGNIGIDLSYVPGPPSAFSGEIIGSFSVAGAELFAMAQFDSTSGGWLFQGGTQGEQSISLSDVVQDALHVFGLGLPSSFPQLTLQNLNISYNTASKQFALLAMAGLAVAGVDCDLGIEISTDSGSTVFQGTLWIGDNIFQFDFSTGTSATVLTGSWVSTDQTTTLSPNTLLQDLNLAVPALPSALDPGLSSASISYDITDQRLVLSAASNDWGGATLAVWKDATAGWIGFFGVEIKSGAFDGAISLTAVPLIGSKLADAVGNVALEAITADLATTAPLTAVQLAEITPDIGAGYPTPPAAGLASGAALTMMFDAGGQTTQISLGTNAGPGTEAGSRAAGAPRIPGPAGEAAVATAPDGTKWFALQKSFGPVSIQKVGIRYDSSAQKLWALMNASLAAGGVTVDLLGLGVGSRLDTFQPSFTVDGIALTVKEGPLAVSGGLIGSLDPEVNFYGEMGLEFGNFSIGALAGYGEHLNHPSFFLYAVLDAPIGGPAFCFVTGLAAGFGYNRSLVVPDVSGVYSFPLVQWATGVNAPASDPAGDVSQQVSSALAMLADSGVVAPKIGEYWLAAGLHFTSFELLDTFALLTVAFGDDLEFDILGLSTLTLPPASPTVFAEIQVELKASYQPASGFLEIAGQLTPNSFVLSQACHLTGGFAVAMWFSGAQEGQFVVTLGGYSASYPVPAYYPSVPRLALNWQVSDQLSISGDLYFALTSSAVMAGGAMSAVWQGGGLRAWFAVQSDFVMVFTPFHYHMTGSIELGAAVPINLAFTTVTVNIHLGVNVELWGPSFSGEVEVDLSIASFTISFGGAARGGDTTIGWDAFMAQLLPGAPATARRRAAPRAAAAGTPAVVQLSPVQGVVKTLGADPGTLNFLVDETFQLGVSCAIPLKTFGCEGSLVRLADGPMVAPNVDFGVGPTGTGNADFHSSITLGGSASDDSTSILVANPVLKNIPRALWEKRAFDANAVPVGVDPVNGTTFNNVLAGFTLVPTAPTSGHTLPIPLQQLQYTTDPNPQVFAWSTPVVESSDPFGSETVFGTIGSGAAATNRPALFDALGRAGFALDTDIDVGRLADAATDYLLQPPALRYLGEAR